MEDFCDSSAISSQIMTANISFPRGSIWEKGCFGRSQTRDVAGPSGSHVYEAQVEEYLFRPISLLYLQARIWLSTANSKAANTPLP